MSRSVAPPSPQEVHRKLSIHSKAKVMTKVHRVESTIVKSDPAPPACLQCCSPSVWNRIGFRFGAAGYSVQCDPSYFDRSQWKFDIWYTHETTLDIDR